MSKFTRGIDVKYRPNSYFWAVEKNIPLVSDIQGAERRKLYALMLQSGQADEIDPELFKPTLTALERQSQGRIHPAFMGGEYLPRRRGQEVEIARITIASTTQDVTCVYARQVGARIHYRVVDEYNSDTLDGSGRRTSLRPLSLKQLVDFFLKSWNLTRCLDFNFQDHGHPPDEVHGFIVDASSSFYAEFEALVRARVDEWLASIPREDNEEDDMEELDGDEGESRHG